MTATSSEWMALLNPGPLFRSVTSPQPIIPQRTVLIATSICTDRRFTTRNLGIIWVQERSCAPARCWLGCITSIRSCPNWPDRIFVHHSAQRDDPIDRRGPGVDGRTAGRGERNIGAEVDSAPRGERYRAGGQELPCCSRYSVLTFCTSGSCQRRTSVLSMPKRSSTRPTLWLTISSTLSGLL